MVNIQNVTEDILWIGASDRRLSRFENLFPLTRGVSYNNYVVLDEKITVFDTSDVSVADQYLENLQGALGDRQPDYLVVLHMEPDHCSQLANVLRLYPDVTVVGSAQTFNFMKQFFPELADVKRQVVKEGDVLETGKHRFRFVAAPMVHWPEVLLAYDEASKALFSADAFGTFGAIESSIFADEADFEKNYLDEARRYYANIVGKFGMQVQAVLKKAAGLEISMLLPLHGPVWRKDLGWFLDKYQKWSTYTPEEPDSILIVYGSLYGHTASAAQAAAARLQAKGCRVSVYDVSGTDVSYLISEVWRCGTIALFCPTYCNGIYPPMKNFLHDMEALGVSNRTFALAENGTWAPASGKLMRAELENLKNVTILDQMLTMKSALHDEAALDAFVEAVNA